MGCGYLGERVAGAWQRQGHRVHAVTRDGGRAAVFEQQGWQPILADVSDPDSLKQLPAADVALFAVGRDRQRTSLGLREVALDGLRHVVAALRGRVGRFLFVSSTSVYGQSAGEWVDEDSPCEPVRENGRVLVEAEAELLGTLGDSACVLRLAGLYGPGRLISRRETLLAATPLGGRPDAWLNLIHVDDAAAAVVACGERAEAGSRWLVCDDRPVRREEYFGRLAQLLDAPPPTFDRSQPAGRVDGLGKRCRNRRLKEQLGVTLAYPTFEEGLPPSIKSP